MKNSACKNYLIFFDSFSMKIKFIHFHGSFIMAESDLEICEREHLNYKSFNSWCWIIAGADLEFSEGGTNPPGDANPENPIKFRKFLNRSV